MKKSGFDQYYDEAVEPGKRERAYAWATAIGLQDVDGLKPSKHLLATAKRHIEGEITQEEARRIVDEYYETKDGHDLPKDTKEADKVAARIVTLRRRRRISKTSSRSFCSGKRSNSRIDSFALGLSTGHRMRRKSQICIGEKMAMAWGVMWGVIWGVIDCRHSLLSNKRFAV